jgi:hypothetical protein
VTETLRLGLLVIAMRLSSLSSFNFLHSLTEAPFPSIREKIGCADGGGDTGYSTEYRYKYLSLIRSINRLRRTGTYKNPWILRGLDRASATRADAWWKRVVHTLRSTEYGVQPVDKSPKSSAYTPYKLKRQLVRRIHRQLSYVIGTEYGEAGSL